MSKAHPDSAPYFYLTKRQRVDRAVNTLTGLLRGVAIDSELNAPEIAEIKNWCNEYSDLVGKAPFSDLIPKLEEFLSDGVITPEEQEDLLWLCQNLTPGNGFYDAITSDIQILQGMLHGILADDEISDLETRSLREWILENEHLKGTYPYDELDSLLMSMLRDGIISDEERAMLKDFFEDFIQYSFSKRVRTESKRSKTGLSKEYSIPGICAACPEIEFRGKTFTFTGSSMKGKREELAKKVVELGGVFSPDVSQKTEYLVIGAAGNPCWAFSCYGRKVEKAVGLRKQGQKIIIVHESDFWDAVEGA